MMVTGHTPDMPREIGPTLNQPVLTVTQPEKIANLLDTLTLIDQVSERIGEDRSGDLGGAGGAVQKAGAGAGARAPSPRDQAIANLPSEQIMQQKLEEKIRVEIRTLRRQIRAIPSTTQAGAAYKLNALYARIRILNRLLASLLEASFEVIKRLFIRVFIDEQPIL
jgi:hypothetical protein